MRPFRKEFDYFLILCESLSISDAAVKAGIGQAGLSKSLKSLEDYFGQELFYRTNRGLKLTPSGKLLQEGLIQTSVAWEEGLEQKFRTLSAVAGKFVVGAHPTVVINSFGTFFPQMCERHPGLDLRLVLKSSQEVTKEVIAHEIDLGVVANPIEHPDLVIVPLRDEFTALWSGSGQAPEKVVYFNPEMIDIFHTLKKYPRYKKVSINDYEVIASMASQSQGLSVLPSPVAARYPGLRQIGKRISEVKICLVYRHDHMKTKTFTELHGSIIAALRRK